MFLPSWPGQARHGEPQVSNTRSPARHEGGRENEKHHFATLVGAGMRACRMPHFGRFSEPLGFDLRWKS